MGNENWTGWVRDKPDVKKSKKKFKINIKKAGERWKKAQNWMGKNINPDILSGNEQRIFGIDDNFFNLNPNKKKRK